MNLEALGKALGVKWTHVPYRGSAPAVTAVATGEVALSISTLPGALHAEPEAPPSWRMPLDVLDDGTLAAALRARRPS